MSISLTTPAHATVNKLSVDFSFIIDCNVFKEFCTHRNKLLNSVIGTNKLRQNDN